MADWCRSNDDSDRVTLLVFSVSGDYRESKGSHSFSPQHREQRLLCGSPNGFWMESKSIVHWFKESTNTEDVSNIIYPVPISLRCGYAYKYRCTTALAQCWPGCVWRWMASRWCSPPLATTARPTCRPFRTKSTALCSSSEIHNIMNFHWLYLMFWPSRCNFLYGTPTMFTDLVNQDIHKYDLSSVEAGKRSEHRNMMSMFWLWCDVWRRPRLCAAVSGLMGGAPCPPEILRKLKTDMNVKEISVSDYRSDSFSNKTVRLFQHIWTSEHVHIVFQQVVYGTTENSPVTFIGFPHDNEELKLNTVGCIMSHTEVYFRRNLDLYLTTTALWLIHVSLHYRLKWWTLLGRSSLWGPQESWWSEAAVWCTGTGRILRKPERPSVRPAGTGRGESNVCS